MVQPNLDAMLDLHRFPADPLMCILLLLYTPIGLCLFLLRLFIGAHVFLVSCVLPESLIRRFLLRGMGSVLGLVVAESGRSDWSVKIYVSNHRTHFDHSALSLLASCSSPSVSCPPGFLCWARGFLELGAPGSRSQLLESLKHYLCQPANPPLLLFPEEEMTNGRAGLLHFRWLPPVSRYPRESDEDFASRVQKILAASLGVCGTSHKAADYAEHVKRRSRDPPPRTQQPPPVSPVADDMARRVKEVLPQVPFSVIHKDLAQTGCVDTTITNILEGSVPYVPEAEPQKGKDAPGQGSSPPTRTSHKGFARRPEDRHLSLQERKEALYESARRRYLEKFGSPGTATEESARG
ncbi:lipid droplet-regulating VLDL assembly factor AUP1 isoform X2 [Lithobates pipiens]